MDTESTTQAPLGRPSAGRPDLPEAVKAGIVAMVRAAQGGAADGRERND